MNTKRPYTVTIKDKSQGGGKHPCRRDHGAHLSASLHDDAPQIFRLVQR